MFVKTSWLRTDFLEMGLFLGGVIAMFLIFTFELQIGLLASTFEGLANVHEILEKLFLFTQSFCTIDRELM